MDTRSRILAALLVFIASTLLASAAGAAAAVALLMLHLVTPTAGVLILAVFAGIGVLYGLSGAARFVSSGTAPEAAADDGTSHPGA